MKKYFDTKILSKEDTKLLLFYSFIEVDFKKFKTYFRRLSHTFSTLSIHILIRRLL